MKNVAAVETRDRRLLREGRVWHGSDKLAQDRNGLKVETVPYSVIMDKYFNPDRYHWDDDAKASSLVVPGDPSSKALVVYDDVHDCREKVDFAKRNALGGIILWELSDDSHRPVVQPSSTNAIRAVNVRPCRDPEHCDAGHQRSQD